MNYAITLGAVLAVLVGYRVLSRRSTIGKVTGPPSPSWIFGHMRQLWLPAMYGEHDFKWLKAHGPVYRLKGFFGEDQLMVSDPVALQYILNSPDFGGSQLVQNVVELVFGNSSLMGLKGQTHKRFRNEFNTAFSAAAVRGYLPIFQKVAQAITQGIEAADTLTINIVPLLSTATLAAIAEAALGYSMDDLENEYVAANIQIMAGASNQSASQLFIAQYMPTWLLRVVMHLPTKTFQGSRIAQDLAYRLGAKVVQEKKDLARRGFEVNSDIFGMLLDPNRSDMTRKPLTDEEIISQTGIIMIAGQETTANTLAFGLMELAKDVKLQETLRAEIHSMLGAADGSIPYDKMPLLNAFIKETLRLYPAQAFTERMALEDTIIPLSQSITTSTGEKISQVPVRSGQIVIVGTASYHRLESRWGEDAHEFKPSRWIEGTVSKGEAVGPYANLLTFLGGPRTCLGWRFALLEMQVLLCEMVEKFSFALPDDDPVSVRLGNTLQPIMSNSQKGVPLKITSIL